VIDIEIKMNKLVLIDDDVELVSMLKEYLQQEGFDVTVGHDGVTAEQYVLTGYFDLMILDVMMPVQDGIQTLRNIRMHSSIPVIMLTAKGDNNDKITGLELGADDYVPKPCTPRELVARVRAILRRIQSNASRTYEITVGDLKIWSSQRRAEWQTRVLELTSTEFNLLETLARHAGAIVSKEELSLQALGRPLAKFDRSIDVHLSSIRQKITQHSGNPNVIQTVYRMGYQLVKE
jgi:two-component system, OmpR family, response regulator